MNNYLIPIYLSFLASFGTLLGYFLSIILLKNKSDRIGVLITFSSIIMLYISIIELIPLSKNIIKMNLLLSILIFCCGIILIKLINKLKVEESSLNKITYTSFIALLLHNFPEGIITCVSTLINYKLGFSISISIMIHNIPEGMLISLNHSTSSKLKRVGNLLLIILCEPIGALITLLLLYRYVKYNLLSYISLFVCGVMISLSINNISNIKNKYNLLYGLLISLIYIIIINIFKLI